MKFQDNISRLRELHPVIPKEKDLYERLSEKRKEELKANLEPFHSDQPATILPEPSSFVLPSPKRRLIMEPIPHILSYVKKKVASSPDSHSSKCPPQAEVGTSPLTTKIMFSFMKKRSPLRTDPAKEFEEKSPKSYFPLPSKCPSFKSRKRLSFYPISATSQKFRPPLKAPSTEHPAAALSDFNLPSTTSTPPPKLIILNNFNQYKKRTDQEKNK